MLRSHSFLSHDLAFALNTKRPLIGGLIPLRRTLFLQPFQTDHQRRRRLRAGRPRPHQLSSSRRRPSPKLHVVALPMPAGKRPPPSHCHPIPHHILLLPVLLQLPPPLIDSRGIFQIGPASLDLGGRGRGKSRAARRPAAESGEEGEIEAGEEGTQGGEAGADDGHCGFDLRPHVASDDGIYLRCQIFLIF